MADKMMRVAGRGEDGLAKALKTTNEGILKNANYVYSESGLWIPEPEVRGTRLTGSIVGDDNPIPTKQLNGVIPIQDDIGVIPAGGEKYYILNFLDQDNLVNEVSFVGRNNSGQAMEIDIRESFLQSDGYWNTSRAFSSVVFEKSDSVPILTDRLQVLSQCIYVYIKNNGEEDAELLALGVMLWS